MAEETAQPVEPDDGTRTGRWDTAIMGVALAACAAEGWLVWRELKDTPSGLYLRYQSRRVLLAIARPCQKCREHQAGKVKMHWHAFLHTQGKFVDDDGVIHDLPNDADRPVDGE